MSISELEGYYLSPQQKRIWLRARQGQAACRIKLRGPLDETSLREAAAQLVADHEIFRTVYRALPGMNIPVQMILDEVIFHFESHPLPSGQPVLDDPALAAARRSDQLFRASTDFDLANGPLLHVHLRALGPNDHELILKMPAICADDRALNLLFENLNDLYLGRAPVSHVAEDGPEEEEPLQYADFADWQLSLLEDGEGVAFWQGREDWHPNDFHLPLEARRPATATPADQPNQPETSASSLLEHRFDPTQRQKLLAFCTEHALPLEDLCFAAWQATLARTLPEIPFHIARAYHLRELTALAGGHGHFAKWLPFPCDLFGDLSLQELTQANVQRHREYLAHQAFFAFDMLPEAMRQPTTAPAFEHQAWPSPRPAEAGATPWVLTDKYSMGMPFTLLFQVAEKPDELVLRLHYACDRFEQAPLEQLLGGLATLLSAAIEQPTRPARRLDCLAPAAKTLLLRTWSQGPTPPEPSYPGVMAAFEAQVSRQPNGTAVVGDDRLWSYETLNRQANRIAHALRRRGAGPETPVVLWVQRTPETLAGLLALLKIGAVCIPLDADQPHARPAAMLEVAAAPLALSCRAGFQVPTAHRQELITPRNWQRQPDTSPAFHPAPEQAAYVIFTSGSSGVPKGVAVSQASLWNLAQALDRVIDAQTEAPLRISLNAPLVFDASVKQWVRLFFGDCLVIVPEAVRPDGPALLAFAAEQQLDLLDLTPSQAHLLLQVGLGDAAVAHPRRLLPGGEAIEPELWHSMQQLGPGRCFNVYGPTECTDVTTVTPLDGSDLPHLGQPIAGTAVYLLDALLQPVPMGVPGELCIGGAGVARGYLNRHDLTAPRYVPDPFSTKAGARLYRSGDRVRFDGQGRLEFLGRIDRQFKIRGFRIEPGEIEAVLNRHPLVHRSLVTHYRNKRLCAYCTPTATAASRFRDRKRYPLPNGLAVLHQNKNETDYLYDEIFVKKTYTYYGIRLPKNALVFDVGANIGMFSLFVLQYHPDARIYAFEPLPPIHATLAANMALYGPDVFLFDFGLSQQEQTQSFTYYPRYSMMSGQQQYARSDEDRQVIKRFLAKEAEGGSQQAAQLFEHAEALLEGRFEEEIHECRLRPLGQVIDELKVEHIDLLKIDVQRAEMDVLLGLEDRHWAMIAQLVMEVHAPPDAAGRARLELLKTLLESHGFQVAWEQDALLEGTDRYNLYASKTDLGPRHSGPADWVPDAHFGRRADILNPEQLKTHVQAPLPEVLRPSAFIILERFPLTRNGKVDYAALPDSDVDRARLVAPESVLEKELHRIWCELLETDKLGVTDGFFERGGHSLLAAQVVAQVRRRLAVVSLRSIFDAPTIRELAALIEREQAGDAAPQRDAELPIIPRQGSLPLSAVQSRMWFLYRLAVDDAVYNTPTGSVLHGPLAVAALERALRAVRVRHEVFRSRFPEVDGAPTVVIETASTAGFELPVIDLSCLPEALRRLSRDRLVQAAVMRPFKLEQETLFRGYLWRLDSSEHGLLLNTHHITSDAGTMNLLLAELRRDYSRVLRREHLPIEPPERQYVDFAAWQQQRLEDGGWQTQLRYWCEQLADVPPLKLPEGSRRRRHIPDGGVFDFSLPPDLTAALRQLGQTRGASLFMTLLAGPKLLLVRYSGQRDFAVGSPIAGRTLPVLNDMMGCFINTLVLPTAFDARLSFTGWLECVRQTCLAAFAHQDIPFERVVEALQPDRRLDHNPLFQVLFSLQNEAAAPGNDLLPLIQTAALEVQIDHARLDLSFNLTESPETLFVAIEYRRDLFEPEDIARLARHYRNLLEVALADPATPAEALNLMHLREREQVLRQWNQTQVDYPQPQLLHALFAEQADRTSRAIALVQGRRHWSYAALADRAAAPAAQLQEHGLQRGERVAVLYQRNADIIATALGIMRAGGMYLPLDPRHPRQRLEAVLSDAAPRFLLTEPDTATLLPETAAPRLTLTRTAAPSTGLRRF